MKSPLLCCFPKTDDDETVDDVAVEHQPLNPTEVAVPASDVLTPPPQVVVTVTPSQENMVTSPEEARKGHKRTSSEASSPAAVNGLASKISFSSNSTSSYKSSTSVLTAIERPLGSPRITKEGSVESVVTAIERTSSPKAVKNDGEESRASGETPTTKKGMASLESKMEHDEEASQEAKVLLKTTPLSPASPLPKSGVSSPESKMAKKSETSDVEVASAASPAKTEWVILPLRISGEEELPEDVITLDEVKKLNQLINSEEFDLTHPFWDKISLFYGDITKINVDAIVNAANDRLGGGGGVDGAIHRAAGYNQLQAECRKHDRPVATGQAVITDACKLSTHIKKIIHCVGPICYGGVTKEKRNQLESCYRRAIELSEENGLRSIAFCCISTGIYGYDNKDAAKTVLKFLYNHLRKEENAEKWDRVVLCLFMDIDKHCYKHFITQLVRNPNLFDEDDKEEESEEEDEDENKKNRKNDDSENDDEEKDEEKEKKDEDKEKKKEGETKDQKKVKTQENKKDEKNDNGKDETDSKESSKIDDKENKTSPTGDHTVENKSATVSETECKAGNSTVEGEESIEETAPSASDTNTVERTMDEELDVGKIDGEKENSVIDGIENGDGSIGMKRAPYEENDGQPPIKREKIERESAV